MPNFARRKPVRGPPYRIHYPKQKTSEFAGKVRSIINSAADSASLERAFSENRLTGRKLSVLVGMGHNFRNLKKDGFEFMDLARSGLNADAMAKLGFNIHDAKEAGLKLRQMLNMGYDSGIGYKLIRVSALDFKADKIPIRELIRIGMSAFDFHELGYPVGDLRKAGLGVRDISDWYNCIQLRKGGFTAREFLQHGKKLPVLLRAGFSASELKAAGFSEKELKNARSDIRYFIDRGYNPDGLVRHLGYSVSDLRKAGFTVFQLKVAGFLESELRAGGYKIDLENAKNLSPENLLDEGFSPRHIIAMGFSRDLVIRALNARKSK